MNFYLKTTLAAVAVVVAAAAVVLLWRSPEAARIEAKLREAVAAAREGWPQPCLDLIAPDFRQDDEDYDDVTAQVRRTVRPGLYRKLEVREIDVTVDGNQADAVILLSVEREDWTPMGMPVRIELDLRKGSDGWKVTGYDVVVERRWRR